MKLHHKRVWITDGDSDSGRAIIRRLVAEGASFIIGSSSSGQLLEEELSLIRENSLQAFVTNTDLTSSQAVNMMLQQTMKELGPVDVLIHNHDEVRRASVESCSEQDFLECLHTNAKTAFICTQVAGHQMAAQQSGSIIYLSSIHAQKPTGSAFAYSAAKGAVNMLAKEAAIALGRSGIRVNTIELGAIEGDQERFASTLSMLYRDYQYKVPSAELVTHNDLAELAAFLSTDGSRHLNGADIRLDGGFLLHYMDVKMKQPPSQADGGGE